jgi:excisionase family DNA binding protein
LTAEQLADRWQVPKAHVYALTRRGEIPAVKLGRYYRYRLDQIEAFEVGADTVQTDPLLAGATTAIAPRP